MCHKTQQKQSDNINQAFVELIVFNKNHVDYDHKDLLAWYFVLNSVVVIVPFEIRSIELLAVTTE
jgi:hypothetical protein